MDIRRKAYSQLLQWKNATAFSKAILIKGTRRVGKSYEGGTKKYEVDFLIVVNGKVIPLEVKSGNRKTHSSLDYYCQTFKKQTGKGIILTKGDLRVTENYRFIPLPMAWFLPE